LTASARTDDTRTALILAAERLMAEHGGAEVSLRQIIEAANVRNMSAVQYHFGSREGLVAAVFDYRMGPINTRRLAVVERLESDGKMQSQRDLVAAWVMPLAEDLLQSETRSFYCRFLARGRPNGSSGKPLSPPPALTSGWNKVSAAIADTLAFLPEPIVRLRLDMAETQIIASLAAIEQKVWESEADRQLPGYEVAVQALIDAVHAMLVGPVSSNVLSTMRTDIA